MMTHRTLLLLALVSLVASCAAFVMPQKQLAVPRWVSHQLHAEEPRQWNFNEGRSPWGLKKNAEIWNGRVAQMAFVVVFLQELIVGKGVIEGIQEGNIFNYIMLGAFAVSTLGLTAFLAIKGSDDLTTKGIE